MTVAAKPAEAQIVGYNFAWTGTGGYSMLGSFTFNQASAGDGAIRDGEVVSLTFEGFLNAASIGVNNTAHQTAGFNFNFNTATGQFFLNGNSLIDTGQQWNWRGGGLGFAAGSGSSLLSQGILVSDYRGNISNPTPLIASPATVVPEPSTFLLLAAGMGAVGALQLRRRRNAA